PLAVYLLVAAASVAATPYRPAQLALAPLVARTPAELVAMNVTAGTLEGVATFAGPALAALLLLTTGPSFVAVAAAVAATGGFFAVRGIQVDVDPSQAVRRSHDRPLDALLGGLTELRHNSDAAVVVGCFIAQLIVRGFLTVLLVSVSFDLLGLSDSGVGWLAAVIGTGGIAGGFYAVGLTERRRLGRPFALALTLWGLPIAVMGLLPNTAVVVAALLTIGLGNAILDVSGFTLIQRLGADRSLGRVFGVLFTFGIGLGGIAALTAPVLVSALGLRPVLLVVGAFLPVLALTLLPRFRMIDQHSEPRPELLTLFSGIPLFTPLPPTTIEKIACRCSVEQLSAGSIIIREGDRGDRFYAIVSGEVDVRRGSADSVILGCGDHFGEIALLRDIVRTATVVARSDLCVATLGPDEFLDALASSDQAYGIAWRTTTAMMDSNRTLTPSPGLVDPHQGDTA
ncbi:MAG TPA: cyclic nucleotide-binding domain-containing protein, partial [Ilumatobacteraceae bacterium]|nr:cyclic nucleotide-binding domain-containing protein [Ilumatobacteraceae bacterium]